MKLLLTGIIVIVLATASGAQVAVKLLPKVPAPLWQRVDPNVDRGNTPAALPQALVSFVNQPPIYAFTQGKLPLFCALEDRIWRRTGVPIQFRLMEQPINSW